MDHSDLDLLSSLRNRAHNLMIDASEATVRAGTDKEALAHDAQAEQYRAERDALDRAIDRLRPRPKWGTHVTVCDNLLIK